MSIVILVLAANVLLDIAAIAIGLLIFFKGRSYVRRKYGESEKM